MQDSTGAGATGICVAFVGFTVAGCGPTEDPIRRRQSSTREVMEMKPKDDKRESKKPKGQGTVKSPPRETKR